MNVFVIDEDIGLVHLRTIDAEELAAIRQEVSDRLDEFARVIQVKDRDPETLRETTVEHSTAVGTLLTMHRVVRAAVLEPHPPGFAGAVDLPVSWLIEANEQWTPAAIWRLWNTALKGVLV